MGLIFDIKRYAINDGPGIRITIFMKGCPLSCVWCHNPEGLSVGKEKLYTKKKCIGCRTCVEACPSQALVLTAEGIVTDTGRCTLCGMCAEVCPSLAMEISGREYSTTELMKEIEKETLFMDRSEGGVTFCGGEPLMHPAELLEGARLKEAFAYFREQFDYIIVDSAPVGLISDTLSLSKVTDFTLYVCRMNYTHKNVLSEIVEIQRSGQLNQISLVVNGGNLAEKKYGYGYGYGYSYGYRDTHKKHK